MEVDWVFFYLDGFSNGSFYSVFIVTHLGIVGVYSMKSVDNSKDSMTSSVTQNNFTGNSMLSCIINRKGVMYSMRQQDKLKSQERGFKIEDLNLKTVN